MPGEYASVTQSVVATARPRTRKPARQFAIWHHITDTTNRVSEEFRTLTESLIRTSETRLARSRRADGVCDPSYPSLEPGDSSTPRSAPLPRGALVRHSSFVRAACVAAHVRICAGGSVMVVPTETVILLKCLWKKTGGHFRRCFLSAGSSWQGCVGPWRVGVAFRLPMCCGVRYCCT